MLSLLQLLSRLFRFDDTDVLLPIVDMANHDNACLHSHLPEPCDPELGRQQWEEDLTPTTLSNATGSGYYNATAPRSGQCMVWRAEEFVAAGQPVCNSYKTLTQDRALLQYGFLQVSMCVSLQLHYQLGRKRACTGYVPWLELQQLLLRL